MIATIKLRIPIFLILILSFLSHPSIADTPAKVYRAAMGPPEEIRSANGFYPRGMDGSRPNQPPPNINLWDHTNGADTGMSRHDSGYVSTTTSRGFAISWVNDHLNHNGYVYHIDPTPNFIDVNGTLRNYSPHPEELEFAALGFVYWGQIIGWERVRSGTIGPFVPNPDYRRGLYGGLSSGGAQPQLAGFPAGHPAWVQNPWAEFANCDLKSSCYPIQTAEDVGTDFFLHTYRKIIAPVLFSTLN
ncbi:enterotoxin A family protein [Yersinia enterocolitica]|uniref:enterotoxin A family protein n=1 Tax=Yersinia enterocolitica TaxID=630 RepID=UPI00398CD137